MSPFQELLRVRGQKVKNGKSPLPLEILRAFKNEAHFLERERIKQAENKGLIKRGLK